jgi:hypothetical protein
MKTDDLIDRLGRDATIVKPLPAAGVRTAVWLAWAFVYLTVVAVAIFTGMSTGGVMVTPLYLLQQAAALATGISAARAAFISVVPGAHDRLRMLPVASAAVWVASLLWESVGNLQSSGTLGLSSQTDWPCVASMALGGAVLGGLLMWMLRLGAPLTPRTTAWLGGVAALSLANIEACLTRPHAFAMTVLVWHGGTAAVIAFCFAAMGRRWLRWPTIVAP